MSKSAKSTEGRKAASAGPLWLRLPGMVREALYETVIGAGLACVDEVLEAERVALCGERYAHLVDREWPAPRKRPRFEVESVTQRRRTNERQPI